MANKRINFRELRKITGIGWRDFLWDLPKKLIGSMVIGLTGGLRVIQVGGLIAGLATAAGAVTALGLTIIGIAGGVFTALAISVGMYSLVKQSRARAKRIDIVVGKNGTINDLKKQIALLAKNLSLKYEDMRPEDRTSLNKLLFSLHIIEGDTITDKLHDLYGLTDDQNLVTEMSKVLNDQTDPEVIGSGLRLLNREYEASLESIKSTVHALLKNMAKMKYPDIDDETRLTMRDLIQTLSQLPGNTFYEQLGSLYGLNETDSKDLKKILAQFPSVMDVPFENLLPLNAAIQSETKLMIQEKNAMNNYPLTTFEKAGVFLRAGFVALVGSLSGFGIVVSIAGLAGVGVATGGVGLIVLVAACAAALVGAIIFTAATRNAQERKARFEQEDKAVADLVHDTTMNVENLNTVIHAAKKEPNLSEVVEENKRLESENQRLKQELEALRSQPTNQQNTPATAQRSPQNVGLFRKQTTKSDRPPPPDTPAPEPPLSPPRSPKDHKG